MEAITLVCDVCHAPAEATATIRVGAKNHLKDLCSAHLAELLRGSRTPKRGRPKVVTGQRRAGAKSAARKASTRTSRKKTTQKKSAQAKGRTRRKVSPRSRKRVTASAA